jgi:hypothetical protein
LEADKFAVVNLCVWDKGLGGLGSCYRSQHELVFVLKKGAASHLNTVELGKNGRKPQLGVEFSPPRPRGGDM